MPTPKIQAQRDYYADLGFQSGLKPIERMRILASEIKDKYKNLSAEYHPDKGLKKSDQENLDAAEKIRNINNANEVLSDPKKRHRYDRIPSYDTCYLEAVIEVAEQYKNVVPKDGDDLFKITQERTQKTIEMADQKYSDRVNSNYSALRGILGFFSKFLAVIGVVIARPFDFIRRAVILPIVSYKELLLVCIDPTIETKKLSRKLTANSLEPYKDSLEKMMDKELEIEINSKISEGTDKKQKARLEKMLKQSREQRIQGLFNHQVDNELAKAFNDPKMQATFQTLKSERPFAIATFVSMVILFPVLTPLGAIGALVGTFTSIPAHYKKISLNVAKSLIRIDNHIRESNAKKAVCSNPENGSPSATARMLHGFEQNPDNPSATARNKQTGRAGSSTISACANDPRLFGGGVAAVGNNAATAANQTNIQIRTSLSPGLAAMDEVD